MSVTAESLQLVGEEHGARAGGGVQAWHALAVPLQGSVAHRWALIVHWYQFSLPMR